MTETTPNDCLLKRRTHTEQEYILQTNYEQQVLASLANGVDAATAAGAFVVMAITASPSLKHPAFEAEDEWRLQFLLDKFDHRINFRDSAMGVTPSVEMSLCKPGSGAINCIREIRVGPQGHPDEALRAVQQLLIRNGLQTVDVKPATIPLRPS